LQKIKKMSLSPAVLIDKCPEYSMKPRNWNVDEARKLRSGVIKSLQTKKVVDASYIAICVGTKTKAQVAHLLKKFRILGLSWEEIQQLPPTADTSAATLKKIPQKRKLEKEISSSYIDDEATEIGGEEDEEKEEDLEEERKGKDEEEIIEEEEITQENQEKEKNSKKKKKINNN